MVKTTATKTVLSLNYNYSSQLQSSWAITEKELCNYCISVYNKLNNGQSYKREKSKWGKEEKRR